MSTRNAILYDKDDNHLAPATTWEQVRGILKITGPLVAHTASEMVDQQRVYVYTGSESGYTNGNWYYYNGSSWVSGGVYNAQGVNVDTTLKVAGVPADAKAVGDALESIDVETDKTLSIEDKPADAKAVGDALESVEVDVETDKTLSIEDKPADAKAVGDALEKIDDVLGIEGGTSIEHPTRTVLNNRTNVTTMYSQVPSYFYAKKNIEKVLLTGASYANEGLGLLKRAKVELNGEPINVNQLSFESVDEETINKESGALALGKLKAGYLYRICTSKSFETSMPVFDADSFDFDQYYYCALCAAGNTKQDTLYFNQPSGNTIRLKGFVFFWDEEQSIRITEPMHSKTLDALEARIKALEDAQNA